jgi:DNA-binding HxlR family transcriptional regulator
MKEPIETGESIKMTGPFMIALNDTLNVLQGKWKLHIMVALANGKMRFREIEKSIPNINPRMLSKELKDLEANGIITRNVFNTMPVSVVYELTSSGYSFCEVVEVMIAWGTKHRLATLGSGS